jgi:hypothetical protein
MFGFNLFNRLSCSFGPRASRAFMKGACECADMSGPEARGPEEHDEDIPFNRHKL